MISHISSIANWLTQITFGSKTLYLPQLSWCYVALQAWCLDVIYKKAGFFNRLEVEPFFVGF